MILFSPEHLKTSSCITWAHKQSQEPFQCVYLIFTTFPSFWRKEKKGRSLGARKSGNWLTIFFPFLNEYVSCVFILKEFPVGSERKRPRIISKSEFIRNRIHKSETSHSTCSNWIYFNGTLGVKERTHRQTHTELRTLSSLDSLKQFNTSGVFTSFTTLVVCNYISMNSFTFRKLLY